MAFHTAVMYKLYSDERFLTPMEIFTIIEQERFNCAVFPKVSAQECTVQGPAALRTFESVYTKDIVNLHNLKYSVLSKVPYL